jgi:hypothetical protein
MTRYQITRCALAFAVGALSMAAFDGVLLGFAAAIAIVCLCIAIGELLGSDT